MSLHFWSLFDGPGMSFTEGIVWPQASQTCCDSTVIYKSVMRLNFLFLLKIYPIHEKWGLMNFFGLSREKKIQFMQTLVTFRFGRSGWSCSRLKVENLAHTKGRTLYNRHGTLICFRCCHTLHSFHSKLLSLKHQSPTD